MHKLSAKSIFFSYSNLPVLKDVSISFEAGKIAAVTGPNGSGKSTLLSIMQGLLSPDSGEIYIDETPLKKLARIETARKIALVSQFSNLVFPFSVLEVVLMARHPYQGMLSFENEEDLAAASRALEITDTAQFEGRMFNELSGGEKQRVMIARSIAQDTPVLLLDEPTSSLDLKHQKFIFELLRNLAKQENRTVVVVSHDINLAALFCDKIALLKNNRIFKEGSPVEILNKSLLEEVYETEVSVESSNSGLPFVRIYSPFH